MEQREERKVPLKWLLAPIVLSTIAGYAGDILGPSLINDHPLAQIALNARIRWQVLATVQLDAWSFYLVGFLRLVSTDPVGFLLGRMYGEAAVTWAEKQLGDTGGILRTVQRWFGKVAPVVVLIAPNLYLCILAGSGRMRPRTFITLNVLGTIGRLMLIRLAGKTFNDELEKALEYVQRYQWWLVGLSMLFIVVTVFRSGGIETPDELAEEIEAEEESLRDE